MTFCYVDFSNFLIEGRHVSAVAEGLSESVWARDANGRRICDFGWWPDLARLHHLVAGAMVGRAALYASSPARDASLWTAARRHGFEAIVLERNARNKEKKIDTRITADMIEDSFTRMRTGDAITLVAGDSDYLPAIEKLWARGFTVEVCFWEHASAELKRAAAGFVSLDRHLEFLGRRNT